ncbi:hypothetical protein Agub_g612, partial [Astrephomene gubernaculifera]
AVSAVVTSAIVRRRQPAPFPSLGSPAPAAATATAEPPPLRVQSAPQVPGWSAQAAGGAEASWAGTQPPQQTSHPTASSGCSAGAGAAAATALQPAQQAQAPSAAPAASGEQLPAHVRSCPDTEALGRPARTSTSTQHHQQGSQQLSILPTPPMSPQQLLYQRQDFVISAGGLGQGATAATAQSTLQVLSSRYTSPLGIFHTYNGVGSF